MRPDMVTRDTQYFLLLNVGHFLDHYFMLIFATVAALALRTAKIIEREVAT